MERQAEHGGFSSTGEVEVPHITTDFELTLHAARAVTAAPGWLDGLKQKNETELLARVEKMKAFLREAKPRNDFEVLLRLHGGDGEYLPAHFIPAAERSGLMAPVDRWVIGHAIDVIRDERRHGKALTLFVNLSHPDGLAALLSGGEVSASFLAPPFQYRALEKGMHKVLSSYDVMGGPTTFLSVWSTGAFRDANPKAYKAVADAFREATGIINNERARAVEIYVKDVSGKEKAEVVALENLPGFPEFHTPLPNRLGINLSVAYDELTEKAG